MQIRGWDYLGPYLWIRHRLIRASCEDHYNISDGLHTTVLKGTVYVVGNTNLKDVPSSGNGPVHLKSPDATMERVMPYQRLLLQLQRQLR